MEKKIPKSIMVAAIFIFIWVLLTMILKITSATFIPSPVDLLKSYWEMRHQLGLATLGSIGITLSGFAIGLIIGIGMGLMMAYSKTFLETTGPFMEFTRPIPVFALIPLFMLWFGIGLWPQILLVALGVSAILGVETYEAIKNMPMVYIRASSNLGADKQTIFKTVVIPYITPHLIGAIRVAAASSWGLDVAAEFMGVQIGLGYNMIVQQMYLNTSGIIAIVIIYSILAILLDQLIGRFEKRATKWTERNKVSFEGL
ncbi:MAG: ABC transporter permease subunit [Desulfobacterales bacterium]